SNAALWAVGLARHRIAFLRVPVCARAWNLCHLENEESATATVGHFRLDCRSTCRTRSLRVPLFRPDPPAQPILWRPGCDPGLDGQCLPESLLFHPRQSKPAGVCL